MRSGSYIKTTWTTQVWKHLKTARQPVQYIHEVTKKGPYRSFSLSHNETRYLVHRVTTLRWHRAVEETRYRSSFRFAQCSTLPVFGAFLFPLVITFRLSVGPQMCRPSPPPASPLTDVLSSSTSQQNERRCPKTGGTAGTEPSRRRILENLSFDIGTFVFARVHGTLPLDTT